MTAPKRPLACVGVVCRKGNDVLLIKRGREPLKGRWSIPGGKMDFGETAREAALRELSEETGVTARITRLIDVVDSIFGGEHFVLIDFEAEWVSGDPAPADDAEAAEWVPVEEAMERVSWDETRRVIKPAQTSPQS